MFENIIQRKRISERIKLGLSLKHMTRKQLSEYLGLSYHVVSDFVRGRTMPKPDVWEKIIDYLELDKISPNIPKVPSSEEYKAKILSILRAINNNKNIIVLNGIEYVKTTEIERIINYE